MELTKNQKTERYDKQRMHCTQKTFLPSECE